MPQPSIAVAINLPPQARMVLHHLISRGELSPRVAKSELGILKLRDRIQELKEAGYMLSNEDGVYRLAEGMTV